MARALKVRPLTLAVLAGSIMLGMLSGIGVVLAHYAPVDFVEGWKLYSAFHDHSGLGESIELTTDSYSYSANDYQTFKVADFGTWDGVSSSGKAQFGLLWIYDEAGNNSDSFNDWFCKDVQGISEFHDTPWEYHNLTAPNDDQVVAEIYIYDNPDGDCPAGWIDWSEGFVWSRP